MATLYGMMDPDEKDAKGIPLTCRLSPKHNIFPFSPFHVDSFLPNSTSKVLTSTPLRAVFIIGPDKRLKLSLLYPATTGFLTKPYQLHGKLSSTGRNFDEILRVIDSLQLTATRKVATPVDWKAGGSCMVVPGVKQEDTAGLFPKGVKVPCHES